MCVSIVLHFASCLYLKHTAKISMPLAEFKPATPASDRPQTLALDRSATGIITQVKKIGKGTKEILRSAFRLLTERNN
jgi:hypothetical protein